MIRLAACIFCADKAGKNIKIANLMRMAGWPSDSSFFGIFWNFFWNLERQTTPTVLRLILGSREDDPHRRSNGSNGSSVQRSSLGRPGWRRATSVTPDLTHLPINVHYPVS